MRLKIPCGIVAVNSNEIATEASETEESEIPAEASKEALASEAGMDMKQLEPEKTKERSEQDDTASEEDVLKERTEETNANADEETKEDEDTKVDETDLDSEEEISEDESLMEEDIELLKEELSKSHEKKDYIILMEDENIANEIQEEYREVTKEDVTEAKEESAGDVQVVVSEMTGETAAEILDEDGVLCVEEDIEIEGLSVDNAGLEIAEGTTGENTGETPNDTWNLEMLHADHVKTEPLERERVGNACDNATFTE